MALDAQRFGEQFFDTLREAYVELMGKGIKPQTIREQDSALIFLGLEKCRDLAVAVAENGVTKDHVWCRYTLGEMKTEEKQKVRDLMSNLRKLNPQILGAPDTLSEFVYDFSITSLKIPQGYQTAPPLPVQPFQFLVVAESELKNSVDEVMEELLRLIGASASIKVLVFEDWGVNMKAHVRMILDRCKPKGHHKSSDWFFLGVPTYSQYHEQKGNPKELLKQVYYLPAGSESTDLQEHPKWCKWL